MSSSAGVDGGRACGGDSDANGDARHVPPSHRSATATSRTQASITTSAVVSSSNRYHSVDTGAALATSPAAVLEASPLLQRVMQSADKPGSAEQKQQAQEATGGAAVSTSTRTRADNYDGDAAQGEVDALVELAVLRADNAHLRSTVSTQQRAQQELIR